MKTSEYLASQGFPAIIPAIRSSDYETSLRDPFLYYLTRRLGLKPAFHTKPKALTLGTWMHARLELIDLPDERAHELLAERFSAYEKEIRSLGNSLAISLDKVDRRIDNDRREMLTTCAWVEAAREVQLPDVGPFINYLMPDKNGRTVLGREVRLVSHRPESVYASPSATPTSLIIQPDLLIYIKKSKKIFVIDFKSHDGPPQARAFTCPFEFQTEMYTEVTKYALASGQFEPLGVDPDATVAGMVHIIFGKPSIIYGDKDRPYHYESEGKRSGIKGRCYPTDPKREEWIVDINPASEGVVDATHPSVVNDGLRGDERTVVAALHKSTGKKPSRVYAGEPSLDLYRGRVTDWYLGRGDYEHLSDERADAPPVDISVTTMFDSRDLARYHRRLAHIQALVDMAPEPENFLMSSRSALIHGRLSLYADFYRADPNDWPEIIQRNRFIVEHRDPPQTPS